MSGPPLESGISDLKPQTGGDAPLPLPLKSEISNLKSPNARAALYRLVAGAFAPPEGSDASLADALDAARSLGIEPLSPALERLAERRRAESREALAVEYARLFGLAIAGEVNLYETDQGAAEIFRKSRELADIAGFYRAFGLEVNPDAKERLDHLSVESEFLGFLCAKQEIAAGEGNAEGEAVSRQAECAFLKDHFLKWVPSVGRRLAEQGRGFYGALGEFTSVWMAQLAGAS